MMPYLESLSTTMRDTFRPLYFLAETRPFGPCRIMFLDRIASA